MSILRYKLYKQIFTQHIKVHDDSKCFKCDICFKFFFPIKSQLKMHYRTHTGDKPIVCQVCNMSCSKKNSQLTHDKVSEDF